MANYAYLRVSTKEQKHIIQNLEFIQRNFSRVFSLHHQRIPCYYELVTQLHIKRFFPVFVENKQIGVSNDDTD